ncbi:MAG TPA: urea carboxylase-associated family protein [Oligoflexus sp.]|uniref:urea carboxylase-associated family protein n=1 Tax=Oligoflexus sp. TaxID=1971216 RepID=UPI002D589691|nr:urea carboxylase-associated family protein [Oligoflexus sp.]HYX36475.1 urea carboxylase-associated family protein [Oligoflexus sp.]
MSTEKLQTILPRSGTALRMKAGQELKIVDPQGEQVCDLICFNADDKAEYLSSGRTLDYASRLFLTKGDDFYSNRSRVMFRLIEDTVGRHDFLLTPCSKDTFRIIYGHDKPHRGCFGNLEEALSPFGITGDSIPVTFNVFMNVVIDGTSGAMKVEPPRSRPGDSIIIKAEMDLIVGLTACSAEQSNNFAFKPIQFAIL